jgi:hypothetical protein
MNENGEPLPPPEDDRTPTQQDAAQPRGAEGWVMPEPVFRQSTGYLPKGVAERFKQSQAAADSGSASSEDGVNESSKAQPAEAEIADQPHVTEEPIEAAQGEATAPIPRKKGRFLRILLIVLGLLLAAGVVVALAAAGLIWYFFQTSESQNLN